MKTIKILYKILLVVALIIVCTSNMSYGATHTNVMLDDGGGSVEKKEDESNVSSNSDLPNLDGNYKPKPSMGSSSKNIIGTILNVLTVLGVVVAVIGIALIGFTSILGSASEKAAGQEKYAGIIIASLLITGASTIAKFIINFAENLV